MAKKKRTKRTKDRQSVCLTEARQVLTRVNLLRGKNTLRKEVISMQTSRHLVSAKLALILDLSKNRKWSLLL